MADETEHVAETPVAEAPVTAPPPPETSPTAPPQAPEPEPRKRYASFYEAWPNVEELRKYTIREVLPRIGLNAEGRARADALIAEYKNG